MQVLGKPGTSLPAQQDPDTGQQALQPFRATSTGTDQLGKLLSKHLPATLGIDTAKSSHQQVYVDRPAIRPLGRSMYWASATSILKQSPLEGINWIRPSKTHPASRRFLLQFFDTCGILLIAVPDPDFEIEFCFVRSLLLSTTIPKSCAFPQLQCGT